MIARLIGRLAVTLTRYAHQLGSHPYLSTGCLHDDHAYCQTQAQRYDGSVKVAATCKFCGAPCACNCHRKDRR